MSADLLRRAAERMREQVMGLTLDDESGTVDWHSPADLNGLFEEDGDAEFVSSWHPGVALAVADWLYRAADLAENGDDGGPAVRDHAVTIARTYLGETP